MCVSEALKNAYGKHAYAYDIIRTTSENVTLMSFTTGTVIRVRWCQFSCFYMQTNLMLLRQKHGWYNRQLKIALIDFCLWQNAPWYFSKITMLFTHLHTKASNATFLSQTRSTKYITINAFWTAINVFNDGHKFEWGILVSESIWYVYVIWWE